MTELIAILALCISVLLLIVHYRNQVERRHGEIAKLRSDLIQILSGLHRNMMSIQMHIETARLELRRMYECDTKYQSIETMPHIIKECKDAIQEVELILSQLNGIDTVKENKGRTLMILQTTEHAAHSLGEATNELEKTILDLLISIRSKQEEAGGKKLEQLSKAQPTNSADPKALAAD